MKSSTEKYLQGKELHGFGRTVASIDTVGSKRKVTFTDGHTVTMNKATLVEALGTTMSVNQKQEMEKHRTRHRDGTVTQPIGGLLKGKVKTYKTEAAAKAALTRRYGK